MSIKAAEARLDAATYTEERRLAEEDELACRLAAAAAANAYESIKHEVADKIMLQDNIEMAMAKVLNPNDMAKLRGEYSVAQVEADTAIAAVKGLKQVQRWLQL
eukprot:SAG22_NODE_317_length_12513_cov_41.467214_6_plen_104_part_00